MKDDYDRMNEYATKGGYEARRFLMANIKAGQTALLRRSFLTDRTAENLRYLFYGDADKAKEPLNFLCAQAWSAAVEGGVNEKAADLIQIDHFRNMGRAVTLEAVIRIYQETIINYAQAVHSAAKKEEYSYKTQMCINFIEEHLCESITIDMIADALGFSATYLSHTFKKETGQTILTYIQNEKMSAAKLMLENTQMSIAQIMEYLGYTSQSYFSRNFKNYTGLAPGQYRKSAALETKEKDAGSAAESTLPGQTEISWHVKATKFGYERGYEQQNYIFSCIRRGKSTELQSQLEDVGYIAQSCKFFGKNPVHAMESMICIWPQAAHAAGESGVSVEWTAKHLEEFFARIYACVTTEEVVELNNQYLIELAQAVAQI